MRRPSITPTLVTVALLVAWLLLAFGADRALAASSKGCVGSGFRLVMPNGQTIAGEQRGTVPAATLGQQFLVRGTYVEFTVRSDTFEVLDYTMTGAPNVLDMTGGRRTPVFAAKTPDLGARAGRRHEPASSATTASTLERDGYRLAMKIQAKDCAQGGIFQMEPEREDGGPTRSRTRSPPGVFYFDNPLFRERIGQVLNRRLIVGPRPGQLRQRRLAELRRARQPAGRREARCQNAVRHARLRVARSVASGGRMGGVLGADAVEVAAAGPRSAWRTARRRTRSVAASPSSASRSRSRLRAG